MGRSRATTPRQEEEIRRLVTLGITAPSQVYRHLRDEGWLDEGADVSEKTVARRIRELVLPDDSGPWSPLDADPKDVERVASVFRYILRKTDGRVWLTRDMMSWISKVVAVVPCLQPRHAYAFARSYRDAHARGEETRCLDLALIEEVLNKERATKNHEDDHSVGEASNPFDDDQYVPDPDRERMYDECKEQGGDVGSRQLNDLSQAIFDLLSTYKKEGQGKSMQVYRRVPGWALDERVRQRIDATSAPRGSASTADR